MKGASAHAVGDRALIGHRKGTLKDPRLPSPLVNPKLKDGSAGRAADGDDEAARARRCTLEPSTNLGQDLLPALGSSPQMLTMAAEG